MFLSRKHLVSAMFLPELDYANIYMNAPAGSLHIVLTTHISLHPVFTGKLASWSTCNHIHWYTFINKSILCKLPPYIHSKMSLKQYSNSLGSQDFISFSFPSVPTELETQAFRSAPSSSNSLQQELKLSSLLQMSQFHLDIWITFFKKKGKK